MSFITVKITCETEESEIIQALLGGIGFESFLEDEGGFVASIEKEQFSQESFEESIAVFLPKIKYELNEEEKQNWNKLWESNYEPVIVSDDLIVRAAFHQPDKEYQYEIIITPKMSFGTGHHATTTLMMLNLMDINLEGKEVADLGCGTGVLGILAMKLGASSVDACDIEDWSVENSIENAQLNQVDMRVTVDTVKSMPKKEVYDVVIANINKNVLLDEMEDYAKMTVKNGALLLSGFYEKDLEDINEKAGKSGFSFISHKEKEQWVSALFIKK